MGATITQIESEQDWLDQVKTTSGKVLVEFFATWCPHCKDEEPIIEGLRVDLNQHGVKVYKVDIDQQPGITAEMEVEGTPTFILFEDGLPVAKQAGEMSGQQIFTFCGLRA